MKKGKNVGFILCFGIKQIKFCIMTINNVLFRINFLGIKMKLTIHKGTNEIGGNCVELKTENTTILLDYGTPLKENSEKIKIDKTNAILISHPHQDHFGEIVHIENHIPVYCGKLSLELMNTTQIFTGAKPFNNNFKYFKDKKSFKIGDFTVTPYLVDHSAVDAYAFLIESDGKRILYSGDFRANGRKSKLFYRMIYDEKLKNIDILILEGTMLKRSNEEFINEQSVEEKIYQTVQNENISFLISSSQNIDRIVSAYRASKRSNKIFVVDIYTAWVLEKLKIVSKSVPNIDWSDVKVIKTYGGGYYQKLKENKAYFKEFTSKVFSNIIEVEEIKQNPKKYFLKVSPWYIEKLLKLFDLKKANIIYSMWKGYLKEEFSDKKTVNLYKNLQKYNWTYAHTSGHADLATLKISFRN